jgi:hypothetical protein
VPPHLVGRRPHRQAGRPEGRGVAADYDETVNGATAANPQVLVTDIQMPPTFQREGIDAAKEVRKVHCDLLHRSWAKPPEAGQPGLPTGSWSRRMPISVRPLSSSASSQRSRRRLGARGPRTGLITGSDGEPRAATRPERRIFASRQSSTFSVIRALTLWFGANSQRRMIGCTVVPCRALAGVFVRPLQAGSWSSGVLDGLEDDAGHDRRFGDEGQVRGVDVGDVGADAAGPSHRDGLGLIGPRSSSATAPSTRAPPTNAPGQSAS